MRRVDRGLGRAVSATLSKARFARYDARAADMLFDRAESSTREHTATRVTPVKRFIEAANFCALTGPFLLRPVDLKRKT